MARNSMKKSTSSFSLGILFSIAVTCSTAAHVVVTTQDSRARDAPSPAAVAELIDAVRSSVNDRELLERALGIGNLLQRNGRYIEAAQLFAALSEKQPDNGAVIYGYALATFNTGKPAEAEPLAERAFALVNSGADPDRSLRAADALVLIAVIRAVRGNDGSALKALQQAVALAPNHFDAQLALGRLLFGMGDDNGALKALSKAVALQPANGQALFFLATTFERAGDTQSALAAYRKLIEIKPESFEGHLGLGVMLLKRGTDAEEGLKELQLALKINPNLYEARIALGRALITRGHPLEAIEHLLRAAALAPDNPEPHYQLSLAYRRLGRKEEAAAQAAIVKRIHESRRTPKVTAQSRLG